MNLKRTAQKTIKFQETFFEHFLYAADYTLAHSVRITNVWLTRAIRMDENRFQTVCAEHESMPPSGNGRVS